MKLEEAFSGCKTKRGRLWKFDGVDKSCSEEKEPFDWTKHLSGEQVQGLSPVNLETGEVLFLGLDLDLKKKPEEICRNIWSKIGTQYFCYRTMGGKWRVVEHLEDWIGVEEAKDRAKDLEKRVEAIGYKCDKEKTLPQSYNLKDEKPGAWWFMPYHNEDTHCYSPGGLKLTKSQTEFRIKYKNHPIVVATIGMIGKGEKGSRRKAIFCVLLYKRHFECDVSIEELNKNFATPLKEKQLAKDIQHSENSIEKNNYNKEYYLNGEPGWIEKICGAKPLLDAKGFDAITATLNENYIYVRARKDFFELDSYEFVDKEQMNDWWKHTLPKTKNQQTMSSKLLGEGGCDKIKSYLTHAGLNPGVIELGPGDVKGLNPGKYLNIYRESGIIAKPGDVSKVDEYYAWLLGKENWLIAKQCLAFMLKEGGEKIQWFNIWHAQVEGLGKGLFSQICQSLFGPSNVKTNVSFRDMTTGHSTIVEGAQIIFLNEVVLTSSTGDKKEMTNGFKNFVTEPNLIINPKNKPQIEIPNLCNFFVFSNSDAPLFITNKDRRAFVVNIGRTEEEAIDKLENRGYKAEILKAIKDPSAFKHHLLNDIEKYDRNMFFKKAPMNEDKQKLIDANKGDFEKIMDMSLESQTFPFGNEVNKDGVVYSYKGIVHTLTLYKHIKANNLFKGIFCKIDDVENYLKEKCVPWNNKGDTTKQIISTVGKIRVYLMQKNWSVKDKPMLEMTERELGELWDIEPGKEDINTYAQEMPNYEEPTFKKNSDEHYTNYCWVPGCKTTNEKGEKEKTEINSDECERCPQCNFGYKCKKCGSCECERPESKIRAAQEKWANRKNS